MKISKLIIKGFRSYDEIGATLLVNEKLSAFIGINSSGKSSALDALRKLFGATTSDKELLREDFHVSPDEEDPDSKQLSLEVKLEFEEDGADAVALYFSHMVVEAEGAKPYLRLRLEGTWVKSDLLDGGIVESKLYFIKIPYGGEETDESKLICSQHLRTLIQIIYIPAIRRPSEQLQYASSSLFHRVLKKIKWSNDFKEKFEQKMDDVNTLFEEIPEFSTINTSINFFWKKFHKDKRYEDASLVFGSSDHESILKKLEVSFDPSGIHRPYGINDLGEGYRSLFYITLVCALLEVEEKISEISADEIGTTGPLLTILAIEEPENHIAPQLLGRVVNNLVEISKKQKSQVFLSSHTSSIIKRIKPEAIYHFRVEDHCRTIVSTIPLPAKSDEAYKFVKEAVYNYPEIYFARLVVIGEGDSEDVLFNRLATVHKVNFDNHVITFVPLGNRFVNHIWKLLNCLNIPYITLLDLDVGRNGGGWGRIKYGLNQLIEAGFDKNEVLALSDGAVMTDESLAKMHKKALTDDSHLKSLLLWVNRLETFDVFYSAPLDLDFLLLQYYKDFYLSHIPEDGGPHVPDKSKEAEKFAKKVLASIKATLKSDEAEGDCYDDEAKELMIYYNYLFLGRGKPTTHMQTLSAMTNKEIKATQPPVITAIFKRILELLEI